MGVTVIKEGLHCRIAVFKAKFKISTYCFCDSTVAAASNAGESPLPASTMYKVILRTYRDAFGTPLAVAACFFGCLSGV